MFLLLNLMQCVGTLPRILSPFCVSVALQFSITFPTQQNSKSEQAQQNTHIKKRKVCAVQLKNKPISLVNTLSYFMYMQINSASPSNFIPLQNTQ